MTQISSFNERFAAATVAADILVGAFACWLMPDRAWAWLTAMLALPVAWALIRIFAPRGFAMSRLAGSIAGAGLILLVAMLAVITQELALVEAAPGELSDRAWGLIMGSLVAVYANVLPKRSASPARARVLRFAGWALVLGGIGHALIWLFAPLAQANLWATGWLALTLVATGLRAWIGHGQDQSAQA